MVLIRSFLQGFYAGSLEDSSMVSVLLRSEGLAECTFRYGNLMQTSLKP